MIELRKSIAGQCSKIKRNHLLECGNLLRSWGNLNTVIMTNSWGSNEVEKFKNNKGN